MPDPDVERLLGPTLQHIATTAATRYTTTTPLPACTLRKRLSDWKSKEVIVVHPLRGSRIIRRPCNTKRPHPS
mgnify:CR=1 FL=1